MRRLIRARVDLKRPVGRGRRTSPGGAGAGRTSEVDLGPTAALLQSRWEEVERHPLHVHPDRDALLRLAQRLARLESETGELSAKIDGTADTVARRFGRLLELLERWGYVQDWQLTERGSVLARCYHECDLLVVESLARGLLDGLDAPTVAALVSCFTYEHRSRTVPPSTWLPTAVARERHRAIVRLADRLRNDEETARLAPTRAPDATFASVAYGWASGGDLQSVLGDEELSGGDFVRNIKQLVDLLRQLGDIAPDPLTATASRRAAEALFRGVVASSAGIDEPGGDGDVDSGS